MIVDVGRLARGRDMARVVEVVFIVLSVEIKKRKTEFAIFLLHTEISGTKLKFRD